MHLSPRQLQILERIAEGKKRTVIAAELGLSLGTVNDYTDRLFKRLDCHTGAEALAKYLRLKHSQLQLF
jgi:DNA-binding NarL/FixJ family response regulator